MSTPSLPPLDDLSLADENRRLRDRIAELERQQSRPAGLQAPESWFELLNRLMENAPLGMAFLDPDFRYLAVNRHLAEMNGATCEQHIGRTVDEVVPFAAVQARQAFRHVMETGLPLFDLEFTGESAKRPGRMRHYSLTWFPVAAAGIIQAVGVVVAEITERRAMEETLRSSEAALLEANQNAMRENGEIEALYATVPAGVALVDAELRYVRINQRMAELNGIEVSDTVGCLVPDVVPDLWPQLEPLYRQVIDHRQPVHDVEIHGFTAAQPGVQRCWIASYDPVTAPDGRFIGVSVFVQEVTESKRAEKVLEENAHLMQRQFSEIEAIYASAPIGLCVFDDQMRWTRINHRMAELNGLPPEAHIGKAFSEIVPGLAAQCEAAFRTVMQTGQPLLDFEVNGSAPADAETVHYWNNRWVPLKDEEGRVIGVSVAIEDTTVRRRAEESLRESERLYRAIGESIDFGVWVCAPDGRNTYASQSFLKLMGMTQEQCSNFGWAEMLHPDDVEGTTAAWLDCVRTEGRWDREHRFRGADGEYHTVLARGVPVRDEHGRLICFAGINLDITLLRRTEERLREGQKLESIGLLAGGIAHDFNNMLVGVIGNASLAQELLPTSHPAGAFMDEVIRTGERAAHLTRQMLAYSGKGRFLIEPLQLSDLVAEMRGLIQTSITKKITLHLDLEPDLPPILADVGQLQQVLLNLVINAAEAIGSENGAIGIRTGVQYVDERFSRHGIEVGDPRPGRYVFLEVSDTGCGMDAATKARIFDPFFSTKFTGRGLGLAALSGILRAHQGAVKVTSRPGSGSSFMVLFPASGAVQQKAIVPHRAPAVRRSGTVVVVDDEETVSQIARTTLERAGYKVLVAGSGPAAIDLFKRHPGELAAVILDLSMPGMSGQETLPELRKIRPEVPVIVSSGYSESETMRLFEGQRVSAFLQKPYTSSRLADVIAATLE